jgi:uncharacterized membrane protein
MSNPASFPRIRTGFLVVLLSAMAGLALFLISYLRWSTFQYRTFDIAFYVQALWNLCHGRWDVSLLQVPMLGNHADLVVFPLLPLFWLWPHPMLLALVQIVALSCMPWIGYRICRRFGLGEFPSLLLALTTLIAPATGFVALHEFHPEALTALFLLLMIDAFQRRSSGAYWLWFLLTLACKENMALLLGAFCMVQAAMERKQGAAWLRRYCLWPGLVALGWLAVYSGLLAPRWNAGNVEFMQLYSHLGDTPGQVLINFFVQPELALHALWTGLQGNLIWGILLPFCLLPLLRPHWILISSPILFQHLLSNRESEWTLYFHYAAPLIPLFWVAMAESVTALKKRWSRFEWLAVPVFLGCLAGQMILGPAVIAKAQWHTYDLSLPAVQRGYAMLAKIPPEARVVSSLPYLSHLATREGLHSLHHILKGLKTLSRARYTPPESADYVLIDYEDGATFDPGSFYYHPQMRTAEGEIVPSSDRLLHLFLRQSQWQATTQNGLTLFEKTKVTPATSAAPAPGASELTAGTTLLSFSWNAKYLKPGESLIIESHWSFEGERFIFPWLVLKITRPDGTVAAWLNRGLCAVEGWDNGWIWADRWQVSLDLPPGAYRMEAIFYDNAAFLWAKAHHPQQTGDFKVMRTIDLGPLTIQ